MTNHFFGIKGEYALYNLSLQSRQGGEIWLTVSAHTEEFEWAVQNRMNLLFAEPY